MLWWLGCSVSAGSVIIVSIGIVCGLLPRVDQGAFRCLSILLVSAPISDNQSSGLVVSIMTFRMW